MGKVIKKKLNGMSWWMKTSLVLLLALVLSMVSGRSMIAQAATVTYGVTVPSTASTGVDGAAQMPTAGADFTTIPTRGNASKTLTDTGARLRPTTGMTNGTAVTLLKLYSPAYASAQTITAPIGNFTIRGYNANDTWTFHLYSHNPSGAAGNKTLMYTSQTIIEGTGSAVTVAPTYTLVNNAMPAGYKLLLEIVYTPKGTVYTPRVYLDDVTAGQVTQVTVTETPAATAGSIQFTAATGTVTEGTATITVTASRTGGTTGAVGVTYNTANGTATAGTDYTAIAGGTLSWAAGDATNKTFTIPITNDTADEAAETFTVTMSSPTNGATLGTTKTQTITITDNDVPTVQFAAATSTGGEATTPAAITVSLNIPAISNVTVNYATASGTATSGSDFTPTSGVLTINAGLTTGTINVPIIDDGTQESAETFTVTLSTPANANLGTTTVHTRTITDNDGPVTTISSCAGCHNYSPTFNDGTARNTPTGQFQGSHNLHVTTNSMACSSCHTAPATTTSSDYGHANGTVNMATISGGTYSKGSFTVANTFTAGKCNTTTCHGAASPNWGTNSTGVATCVKCHGVSGTTTAAYTTTPNTAAPGYNATGKDTGGSALATDAQVGAHDTHLRALNTISSPIACNECHTVPATSGAAGHTDTATPAEITFGTLAKSGTGTLPSYNSGTFTCSNTYCHYGRDTAYAPPAATTANVVWNNTAYLSGTKTPAADCGKCHASPPLSTGTHAGVTLISACNGCHSHVNVDGTFNDATLHINGIVEASGSCIDCHATAQTGTHGTPRAAVTTEFGLAYGHKKSGRTPVTDSDCIVCHLEGEFASQKPSATKHKDGNIDLRDPDGAGETAITNNSNAAFTFTKYAVSYAAGSRTSTLGNTVAEVVTVKFCMKCHDSNGATNTTARTRNATNTATTGTAFNPFEGINLGATYTTTNGAAAAGGVVDVATQFNVNNSSRHPVGAPNSRAYPSSTRLLAPYNNIGTTRNSNTQAANTGSPRVKANSVIMVCDDCHTTATTITTRTITAHGSGGTTSMRGTYFVASPTLCTTCHIGVYADATNGRHNAGSAFGVGTTRAASAMTKCNFCHFSINDATYSAAKRPRYAQDVHGFKTLYGVTTGWTAGAANGIRPVAFMRSWATGGGSWPTTASPRPYVVVANATTGQAALAAGQSTCGGSFAFTSGSSGLSCSSNGHTNYSPGGSY